jgi:hypothetical protein
MVIALRVHDPAAVADGLGAARQFHAARVSGLRLRMHDDRRSVHRRPLMPRGVVHGRSLRRAVHRRLLARGLLRRRLLARRLLRGRLLARGLLRRRLLARRLLARRLLRGRLLARRLLRGRLLARRLLRGRLLARRLLTRRLLARRLLARRLLVLRRGRPAAAVLLTAAATAPVLGRGKDREGVQPHIVKLQQLQFRSVGGAGEHSDRGRSRLRECRGCDCRTQQ